MARKPNPDAAVTAYFISDLHLEPSRPEVTAALASFLERIEDADALYILGDLFEFWVGDDDDAPIVAEVAGMLSAFSARDADLYLMHGNRDFLIGEAFAQRCGAVLLDDPTVVSLDGTPVLLMHGDSLCTRDEEYMAFRALARTAEWQQQILGHSLAERRALAQQLRMASKDAGSRKADDIMDVTENEVVAAMEQAGCATLIHGHTHRPARHENAVGTRWVLGDWDKSGWYIKADAQGVDLVNFHIEQ